MGGRSAQAGTPGSPSSEPLRSRRNHWVNHLERHASQTPERAALRFEGRTTTWRRLADRVAGLADALARRGLGQGDRLAVLMSNRPEFLEAVLAANRLGAVAVPINFRLSEDEVAYILDHSGAVLLVADAASSAVALAAR